MSANIEAVHDALETALFAVSSLPATRYVGNAAIAPAPSVAYVETDFVPATATRITMGDDGIVDRDGVYVVRLYSASGAASTLEPIADDVLDAFPRGLALTASGGTIVRVKGQPAPTAGQSRAVQAGRSVLPVSIFWMTSTVD